MSRMVSNKDANGKSPKAKTVSAFSITDKIIGTIIDDRYEIKEHIGAGGFGNVYRAEHLNMHTDVAIKIIHPHLMLDTTSRLRLEQEAISLNKLDSEHIVKITDYSAEPLPFVVMEYFPGNTLDQIIKENGPLAPDMAIELFQQICKGLDQAHTLGFVHRDLKPSNIIINTSGPKLKAKILDFGIAKMLNADQGKITSTGEVVGSPQYMSPEQWKGGQIDYRSDIYSLGCLMYEVMMGKPAFEGTLSTGLLVKHLSTDPLPFSQISPAQAKQYSPDIEKVIKKCLMKEPQQRYSNVKEIQDELNRITSGQKVQANYSTTILSRVSPTKLILGGTAITATIILALLFLFREPLANNFCEQQNQQADQLKASGNTDQAKDNYQMVIEVSRILPDQNQNKLHAMRSLMAILQSKGKWSEASALEKQLRKATVDTFRDSTPVERLFGQAQAELETNHNIGKATKLAEGAANLAAKQGTHTVDYAHCLDLIATIAFESGNIQKAEQIENQVVAIAQELLEADDPNLAGYFNHLGLILSETQNLDGAEQALQHAIVINMKTDKKDVSANFNLLAILYLKLNRPQEALECIKKVIKLGSDYGSISSGMLLNMAIAYERLGKPIDAITYFQKALDYKSGEDPGLKPENKVVVNSEMAHICRSIKHYKDAIKYYQLAIDMQEKKGVKPPPIEGRANLGFLHKCLDETRKESET